MTNSIHGKLFELIRLYNLKGKFAGGVYDTVLSPLEAYVVVEVAAKSISSINELVEILGVDRSAVSRAVSRLSRNKYLVTKRVKEDTRTKSLSLTKRGLEFLAIHDAFNERFIRELSVGLIQEDLSKLAYYINLLATNDGARPVVLRPNESELLRGVRRLARCWDILTSSFLQSEYSVLHWQILTEVGLAKGGLRPFLLTLALNIPKSSLSQILSRYRAAGLLVQKRTLGDGRGYLIHLTQKGKKAVKTIKRLGATRIRNALKDLPIREQEEFLSLMDRYVRKEKAPKVSLLP